MKKVLPVVFLLCLTLVMTSGCGRKIMTAIPEGYSQLAEGKTRVVFFRTSNFLRSWAAHLLEETESGNVKYMGVIDTDTKIQWDGAPGPHTFVICGESAQIVKGVLAPNKIYYVRVSPHLGFWKGRFHPNVMTPEDLADPKTQKKIKDCKLRVLNERGKQWGEDRLETFQDKLMTGKSNFNGDDGHVILEQYGVNQLY